MSSPYRSRLHRRGFTLAEVMITVGITALFVAGMTSFMFFTSKSTHTAFSRNGINADIRQFTQEMAAEARNATRFEIYASFDDRTRILSGLSGDMLVLYFHTGATPTSLGTVSRIVVYYRDAPMASPSNPTPAGPVRRLVVTGNPAVLPTARGTNDPIVWEVAEGLANGRLFRNNRGRAILVQGEIQHGTSAQTAASGGRSQYTVTNTYNFTIGPRI